MTDETQRNDMYQRVILTLRDGRQGVFMGPVLLNEEGAFIDDVKITKPQPLPPGCKFDLIEGD